MRSGLHDRLHKRVYAPGGAGAMLYRSLSLAPHSQNDCAECNCAESQAQYREYPDADVDTDAVVDEDEDARWMEAPEVRRPVTQAARALQQHCAGSECMIQGCADG